MTDLIEIDFNDAIYQATGIARSSLALREERFEGNNGIIYTLQAIKKSVGDKETLYVSLKNSSGFPVEDIQVKVDGKTISIDGKESQDAVVIKKINEKKLEDMELLSTSESLRIKLRVGLEKLRELPPKKARGKREKEKAEDTKRRKR